MPTTTQSSAVPIADKSAARKPLIVAIITIVLLVGITLLLFFVNVKTAGQAIGIGKALSVGQGGIFLTEATEEVGKSFTIPIKANLGNKKSVAFKFSFTYDAGLSLNPQSDSDGVFGPLSVSSLKSNLVPGNEGVAVKEEVISNDNTKTVTAEFSWLCADAECSNALTGEDVTLATVSFTGAVEGSSSIKFNYFDVYDLATNKDIVTGDGSGVDITIEEKKVAPVTNAECVAACDSVQTQCVADNPEEDFCIDNYNTCVGKCSAPQVVVCTDSDGGFNPPVKGETTGYNNVNQSYDSSINTVSDSCVIVLNPDEPYYASSFQKVDNCSGEECGFEEFGCSGNVVGRQTDWCQQGCENGACAVTGGTIGGSPAGGDSAGGSGGSLFVCDATHPSLCTTQPTCSAVGLVWYQNECILFCPTATESGLIDGVDGLKTCVKLGVNLCDATHLNECKNPTDCVTAAGSWNQLQGICQSNVPLAVCDVTHLDLCTTPSSCSTATGAWYEDLGSQTCVATCPAGTKVGSSIAADGSSYQACIVTTEDPKKCTKDNLAPCTTPETCNNAGLLWTEPNTCSACPANMELDQTTKTCVQSAKKKIQIDLLDTNKITVAKATKLKAKDKYTVKVTITPEKELPVNHLVLVSISYGSVVKTTFVDTKAGITATGQEQVEFTHDVAPDFKGDLKVDVFVWKDWPKLDVPFDALIKEGGSETYAVE